MPVRLPAGVLAGLTALGPAASATGAVTSAPPRVEIGFQKYTLPNGLEVILREDHRLPIVAVNLWYHVGPANETAGRTGFAHLFEHMMFQGSGHVGDEQHFKLLEGAGASMINGTTDFDRTNYMEDIPSNQLELALWLESDRMGFLLDRLDQPKLSNQQDVVRNERRQSVENQPYGLVEEELFHRLFPQGHPYYANVMGSHADIQAARLEDVKDFFRVFYAPNNAALALVGDFKPDVALARIKNYLEAIPSQPAPPPVDTAEPEQTAERRFTVQDPLARLPQIIIGYKGIAGNTPDSYAMQVLSQALVTGQSSRLYQKLVKEKELVTGVFGFPNAMRGGGDYQITATVAPGKKLEDVEAAINDEIARIQREPIADWELAKAKNSSRRSSIQALQNSLGTATRLSQFAVFYNDPNLINTQFDKIAAVTKDDVQRVANKYLKATNRTVGITVPQARSGAAAATN